jgi:glutathione S-transferase
MKIYWIKAQAPLRVLALAKYLGIKAEFVQANLLAGGGMKSPDYAALNPNMKAPMLVDSGLVLWESEAIMAYLCIKAGSDLWPAHNPMEQVEVMRWISWNNCHWAPAVGPFYFEHIVKSTFGIGPPNRDSCTAAVPNFATYAEILNGHLADRTYLACGRLTIADFHAASMATYWKQSEMPVEDFPNIVRWIETLQRIPAWADPWPEARLAA